MLNLLTMLKLLGMLLLLLSMETIKTDASPLARIHVKFAQPPHHVQEHRITTDEGRIISQHSYLSIGRRNAPVNFRFGTRLRKAEYHPIRLQQPQSILQRTTFMPVEENDLNYSDREYNQATPDFSNGLDYPDPLLLTGAEAMLAVKYIYGRGELFFQDIPHVRALLRNQEERLENGLDGNILSSLRPNSPWFRRDD